jgi:hypothetical protein
MACEKKNHVLSDILGELPDEERKTFRKHATTCMECKELLKEFEETQQLLERRALPEAPEDLVEGCLRKIGKENRHTTRASVFGRLLNRLAWWQEPAWQWAVLVIVFCGGLGLGKILFDPPTWVERYGKLVRNRPMQNSVNENRSLRNYFLSVETLFLDLSNMDDRSLLDDEEWDMEMDITREVLHRTRQIKNDVKDRNNEIYQLVTEIEWVLEDMLGTEEFDFAGLSKDVRQVIDERQLLTKIHEFIS